MIQKDFLGTTRDIPQVRETGWGETMTLVTTDEIDCLEGTKVATKIRVKRMDRPFQEVTATGAATSIDFSLGSHVRLILQANTTLTLANASDGGNYFLYVKQDATGGRTITWPSAIKWRGGSAPTLTGTANSRDVIALMFHNAEAIYLGEFALNFA